MVRPAGIYTYHNTFIAEAAITIFSNGHFRNNLFIGPSDNRHSLSAATLTTYSTLDYNGYRKKNGNRMPYRWRRPADERSNHTDEKNLITIEAATLREFSKKTGLEQHGIEVDADIFENVSLPDPQKRGKVYPVAGYDFQLRKNSAAVDAGVVIPNINDQYTGKAPDLGAYERGRPIPIYGPRPRP
jgi:hypothetical protein